MAKAKESDPVVAESIARVRRDKFPNDVIRFEDSGENLVVSVCSESGSCQPPQASRS